MQPKACGRFAAGREVTRQLHRCIATYRLTALVAFSLLYAIALLCSGALLSTMCTPTPKPTKTHLLSFPQAFQSLVRTADTAGLGRLLPELAALIKPGLEDHERDASAYEGDVRCCCGDMLSAVDMFIEQLHPLLVHETAAAGGCCVVAVVWRC